MIRKLTLVFLLFIGSWVSASAQVRDTVTIHIPPYTDTTCVGTQQTFYATATSDTFTGATYKWFVNNVYTGINLDTFLTTALNDGDSVFARLIFTNSFGILDSTQSNAITIHHLASIQPRVITALISGSNPDCAGHPLTFQAYPVNGGITPQYQWFINSTEVVGADSTTLTGVFGGADTIICRMISNSPCAAPFSDTAYSIPIPIIHIHLTASISISAVYDTICGGGRDTFNAVAANYGDGATYQWYVNNTPVAGAISTQYITDSLRQGDSVFVVLTTPDTCVLNPVIQSNVLYVFVKHVYSTHAQIDLTTGTNPGCLGDPVTFTGVYDSFGTAPYIAWYVNGVLTNVGSNTLSGTFANLDQVYFTVHQTDGQCYDHDTIDVSPVILIRDTTPVAPVVHLHGDTLVTYSSGTLTWYRNGVNSYTGATLVVGATDTFYHPVDLGYYFAVANNVNCASPYSNIIYISLLEVENVAMGPVNIYPNPTSGTISMDWLVAPANVTVNVYNALGQNLVQQVVNNRSHLDVDLSALPNGNYYLELRGADGKYETHKIVLQHN
jgi:hypothetical protein